MPVENARLGEHDDEDPTFCEVCGRSDREDRLLLCDGCDAGYHMECLEPPLQEVPVDEWFCPECAASGAASAADAGPVSEEEVSLLLADVVPTASRLRPHAGRTRAIARTRQSERVRATVNRNRISTARRIQHVPRHLVSSLLDETIEAVAAGLSAAVPQRPVTPRAPARRRRRAGRRKKVSGRKKTQAGPSGRGRSSRARPQKRQSRVKRRRGRKAKSEATARSRIARRLYLQRPAHGACVPSVCKPADPSLGLMRAEIGAASLSLFGDPYELDPFDSSEEVPASPASPLSAKRRILSRSALQSHQPVARPVSMGLSRRGAPAAAAQPQVDSDPDLLGSILSGQSFLMMNSADIVIHRDGSLSARGSAPVSFQRSKVGLSRGGEGTGSGAGLQPRGTQSENRPQSLGVSGPGRAAPGAAPAAVPAPPAPTCVPALTSGAAVKLDSAVTAQAGQPQTLSGASRPGLGQGDGPRGNGDVRHSLPLRATSSKASSSSSDSPSESVALAQARRPAPGRADNSELPQSPKIRRDDGRAAEGPARGQRVEIPSSCISRLTGREGPGRPGRGARGEGEPSSRGAQEPGAHSGGAPQPPAPPGPARGKGVGSTFESFRINIPGNTAQCSRVLSPGFCNTFRPVDSKAPRRHSPTPLFSVRKTKQLKSEIYDPFNPTGSDSSSASSSPEHLGPGLLPSEITRTISVDSPEAPALPPVRCVTSYTVQTGFGKEPRPPQAPPDAPQLQGQEEPAGGRGAAAQAQRPSPQEPWGDGDRPPPSSFFGSEGRTVTCVAVADPDAPPSPSAPHTTMHRVVELRSPTRSRSTSSSRGRRAQRPQAPSREHRRARSGSGSRSSRSGDRSSRSVSPAAGEDQARRQRPKARSRRSSSDRSSSHERAKRRKAKARSRERRRGSWGRGRRRSRSRSRSRSCSPGGPAHEGRRRKRRRSGSRSRGREGSPPSSLERSRRPRHPRERRERLDKEGGARSRDRRGSRERRKRRSRSPSPEHRPREHRRPRSREKRPRPRARSPDRKLAPKEASPAAPPQEEPRPDREHPARPPAPAGPEADAAPPQAPPAEALPAECPPEDLDYGDAVEAGHLFEDLSGEAVLLQLDDMSSPPSPESSDSSPERCPLPRPAPPASQQPDASLAMAVIRREVSLIHGEDPAQPLPGTEGPREQQSFQPGTAEAAEGPGAPGGQPVGGTPAGREEGPSQNPLLRAKALVKRVTWNLQEPEGGPPAGDRGLRTPLLRPQKPREAVQEAEDVGPAAAFQQAAASEPAPPGYVFPELGFPDADPSQAPGDLAPPWWGSLGAPGWQSPAEDERTVPAQVYSPSLPPVAALPSSLPPYAPASQPAVHFILQGSLPLTGGGVAQSLAPVPPILTTASEPAGQAAAATAAAASTTTTTNNSEERVAAPRPASEKARNEEYMKKLHVQERAVEEVKLAIKPFYQKREVTKDEYKDILRKAVQKICHSKSGEINPVKVGNLVRAYVGKYRHMRRHRRPGAGQEPPAQGAEG